MGRFVEGADRSQLCFLPECLDDDNPVQVIEAFVEALDLPALGFACTSAALSQMGGSCVTRTAGRNT